MISFLACTPSGAGGVVPSNQAIDSFRVGLGSLSAENTRRWFGSNCFGCLKARWVTCLSLESAIRTYDCSREVL